METIQQQITDSVNFLTVYGGDTSLLNDLLKNAQHFKEVTAYHSGGGFRHIFCQLHDNRIISLHTTTEDAELSFSPWETIDAYYEEAFEQVEDIPNTKGGFGLECYTPDCMSRTVELDQWEQLLKMAIG